jgi:hypothetical protein
LLASNAKNEKRRAATLQATLQAQATNLTAACSALAASGRKLMRVEKQKNDTTRK